MTARVLLVEDDARLATMVADYLGEAGFRVVVAATGKAATQAIGTEGFDLVILDLMLPDADGLDLCRSIRARSDIPMLMLTARGDPLDRVVGLELGADDYLPSPSSRASCWHGCVPSCDVATRLVHPMFCALAGSRSTRVRARCASTDSARR